MAERLITADHKLVRFFLPPESRWPQLMLRTTGLGEALTDAVRAIAAAEPAPPGVIDTVDFNATTAGQRIVDDARLACAGAGARRPRYRLGLDDVEPDILGRAYEYLLRKFAEGQGQSAGEFYTPPEVAVLMARILDPQPGMTVYDPCCGSGWAADQVPPAADGDARRQGQRAAAPAQRRGTAAALRTGDQPSHVSPFRG